MQINGGIYLVHGILVWLRDTALNNSSMLTDIGQLKAYKLLEE